jgi:hypothetical protein
MPVVDHVIRLVLDKFDVVVQRVGEAKHSLRQLRFRPVRSEDDVPQLPGHAAGGQRGEQLLNLRRVVVVGDAVAEGDQFLHLHLVMRARTYAALLKYGSSPSPAGRQANSDLCWLIGLHVLPQRLRNRLPYI